MPAPARARLVSRFGGIGHHPRRRHAFPFPVAALGALKLFGGLALVVGYQVRLAGLALAAFTVAASVVFHAFWSAPAVQQFVTQLLFMKNNSVAGGKLLISALGVGPLSIDARLAVATAARFEPVLARSA